MPRGPKHVDEQSPDRDLAQLNRELSSVLSVACVPFLIVDGDLRIRRVEAAELLGLSPEHLGQPVDRLRFMVDSSGLNELASQAIEDAATLQREVRAHDGRWYSMRVGPFRTVEGKIDGALVAFVDIHEWKQSGDELRHEREATVRSLIETMAQTVLAIGNDGRIVLVNASAEAMFGYSRAELLGLHIASLIPAPLRERHTQYHAAWLSQPQDRPTDGGRDLVALRKDGFEFPVEISLSHIRNQGETLAIAFVTDISERKKGEASLLQYQRELRELTARLLVVQETEIKLLARELHDVFSQKLASVGMQISSLNRFSRESPEAIPESLRGLSQQVSELAEDIHRMSRRLHPAILGDLGLEAALQEECDSFSQQTGIPVEFHARDVPRRLPEDIALCLYRVAQESLRNIRRHAQAVDVRLFLASDGEVVTLSIEDSGDGFDLEEVRGKGGLGLISMEERARLVNGILKMSSQPGVGTRVEVRLPLTGRM